MLGRDEIVQKARWIPSHLYLPHLHKIQNYDTYNFFKNFESK